jgi:signal transduction histidine kinase
MKKLFICLTLIFAALGLILYFNMFHFACVAAFILSLLAGALLTRYMTAEYSRTLEQQEKLRKDLTADVAHELRTPLTSIGTHLEAMSMGIFEPTSQRLQSCCDEVMRLSKLVSDLETLSKYENGLKLERQEIDLLEVVNGAAALSGRAIAVSGGPVIISADRDRIAQVVANLLSNAEKYTPAEGEIGVSVDANEAQATITVTDSGAGIAQEDLPYIFERFYRTDKSRTRKTGGAGIGLAIVRSIVSAHGGRVAAASEPGRGSVFTVVLPRKG